MAGTGKAVGRSSFTAMIVFTSFHSNQPDQNRDDNDDRDAATSEADDDRYYNISNPYFHDYRRLALP